MHHSSFKCSCVSKLSAILQSHQCNLVAYLYKTLLADGIVVHIPTKAHDISDHAEFVQTIIFYVVKACRVHSQRREAAGSAFTDILHSLLVPALSCSAMKSMFPEIYKEVLIHIYKLHVYCGH